MTNFSIQQALALLEYHIADNSNPLQGYLSYEHDKLTWISQIDYNAFEKTLTSIYRAIFKTHHAFLNCEEIKKLYKVVHILETKDIVALQSDELSGGVEKIKNYLKNLFIKKLSSEKTPYFESHPHLIYQDRQVALAMLQVKPENLAILEDQYKQEISLVVQIFLALKYIDQTHEPITSLKSLFKEVLTKDPGCIKYACLEVRSDPEIATLLLSKNGLALGSLGENIKNDTQMILLALVQNGLALKYVNKKFLENRKIILTAIEQNGLALEFAGERWQNDKEIVQIAALQNLQALNFTGMTLRNDRAFLKSALFHYPKLLLQSATHFQVDEELLHLAIRYNPEFIEEISICNSWPIFLFNILFQCPNIPYFFRKQEVSKWVKLATDLAWDNPIDFSDYSIDHYFFQFYPTIANPQQLPFYLALKECLSHMLATSESRLQQDMPFREFYYSFLLLMSGISQELILAPLTFKSLKSIFLLHHKKMKNTLILHFLSLSIEEMDWIDKQSGLSTHLSSKELYYHRIRVLALSFDVFGLKPFFSSSMQRFFDLIWSKTLLGDTKKQVIILSFFEMIIVDYMKFSISERNQFFQFIDRLSTALINKELSKSLILNLFSQLYLVVNFFGISVFMQCLVTDLEVINQKFNKTFYRLFELGQRRPPITEQEASIGYAGSFEKFRNPYALFDYLNSVKDIGVDISVKDGLLDYVYHVLKGDFYSYRNEIIEDQPHLAYLYECFGLKASWLEDPQAINLNAQGLELFQADVDTHYRIFITHDPEDLLLLGTDIQGSCLNVSSSSIRNKALLGYIINGDVQAIVMKDTFGSIVGRAILRLMLDQDESPALFLEKIYLNRFRDMFEKALINMAVQKAQIMDLPLYSSEVGKQKMCKGMLIAKEGRAPYTYSDALQGVQSGRDQFIITDFHRIFPK